MPIFPAQRINFVYTSQNCNVHSNDLITFTLHKNEWTSVSQKLTINIFLLQLKKSQFLSYLISNQFTCESFLPHRCVTDLGTKKKKNRSDKEKKRRNRTVRVSDIGEPKISRMRDIETRRTHLTVAEVRSHTFARTVLHCFSPQPSGAVELLFPSPRPLVSRSLRYLCTLCSRTYVVVRMHTRTYIRRVLRKLAPYASIQISHVCTYFVRPASTLVSRPSSSSSCHSSLRRFRPLQSNGFLSLSNSHTQCCP